METNAKEKTTVVHHEVCSKGLWVKDIKVGDQFIGFYVARNPRLDPYRDPAKGKVRRCGVGTDLY
jgi:hypothetical protein